MASTPRFEPGQHWWEASALTTAPPLLPQASSQSRIFIEEVPKAHAEFALNSTSVRFNHCLIAIRFRSFFSYPGYAYKKGTFYYFVQLLDFKIDDNK